MKRLKIILREFFSTDKREKLWRVIISLIIGVLCFVFMDDCLFEQFEKTFYSVLCDTLGILAGFTLSTIAILSTSGNKDILGTKKYIVRHDAKYGKMSLYTSVTANLVVVLLL